MTTAAPPPPTRADRPDDVLAAFVAERCARLQHGYLADVPSSVQGLAVLRRAVGREPWSDPAAWGQVFERVPDELLGRGDAVSPHEKAAHAALTIFAVHQQGRREPMHRAGHVLGTAVRALASRPGADEAPVRRRFEALGTASTEGETLHHLRGLVTQLRGAGIALDYGRLAVDLRRLRDPRTADRIRLAWGREYHRYRRTGTTDPTTSTENTPSTDQTPGDQ